MKLRKNHFNFKHTSDEIVANFRPEAEDKKIDIRVISSHDLPLVNADPDMSSQMLNNLLNNALRYARSFIRISLKADKLDGAPALHVCVEDDGEGIAPDNLSLLFNKFEQINRPVGGSGYKGTGLGLSICKEIVELHHGKIWAESVLGEGSKFHFLIPL